MAVSHTSSSNLDLTISVPSFVRDFDINQVPSLGSEDEWMIMTTKTMEVVDEENINGVVPPKKLRLSKEQSHLLEENFRQSHTLNPKQKETLALKLKVLPRQVEVWFQNRRARSKLKQTEMEYEYLKKWVATLTEQNRRLHSKVEELKAMKVGPPTVISPASTLSIMCPRCERVTTIARGAGSIEMGVSTAFLSKGGTSAFQSWPSSAAC